MKLANEVDAIFLEDMKAALPNFGKVNEKGKCLYRYCGGPLHGPLIVSHHVVEEISQLADDILQGENSDLVSPKL